MPRFRSRCAAAVLALALVLSPLAAAAPTGPAVQSWWSALADLLDVFDFFGFDGIATITAPEGPWLEPDGVLIVSGPEGSDDVATTDGTAPTDGEGAKAPNR